MPWPLSQDYNEAIQNPATCFGDPELRQGQPVTNALGLPLPCSGNFADVYAVQSGQRKWAVKCFTRQIPGLRERYAEISKHLGKVQLPFMVEFKFLDQGIKVHNRWYPILKMHWVEGFTLNQFVQNHLDKPQILQKLCQIWLKLAAGLGESNTAHCDLQHGNVILVPAQAGSVSVRLVDYDGMWVPGLEFLKSIELGHPSYQHPQRQREGGWSPHIDRFSHLVICTALHALVVDGRTLWDKYDNGDNLLFKQQDFEAPHKSPLFAQLLRLQDPVVGTLVRALIDAMRKPIDETPLLESLLPAQQPSTKVKTSPAIMPSAATDVWSQVRDAGPPITKDFRHKKRSLAALLLLAAVVLLVGGFAGTYWFMKRQSPSINVIAASEVVATQSSQYGPAMLPQTNPKVAQSSPKPSERKEPEPKPEPKHETRSRPQLETDVEPPSPQDNTSADPRPTVADNDKRLPVPDRTQQARAEQLIKDLYKAEYAKNQPEDVVALATKFLKQAPDTKDDVAARYVMLTEAARLAATGGAWKTAWKAVDDLASHFRVNPTDAKFALLDSIGRSTKTPDQNQTLVDAILPLVNKALADEDHDLAIRLLKLAEPAAKAAEYPSLFSLVQDRARQVDNSKKHFEQFKQAALVLTQDSKNSDANLTAGKYLCFFKNDWAKGLQHLGLGSSTNLRVAAQKDLAGAASAAGQVEIGDSWWDLGEADRDGFQTELQDRACHWYRKAMRDVTGLTLTKVEKRIDLVARQMRKEWRRLQGFKELQEWRQLRGFKELEEGTRNITYTVQVPKGNRLVVQVQWGSPIESIYAVRDAQLRWVAQETSYQGNRFTPKGKGYTSPVAEEDTEYHIWTSNKAGRPNASLPWRLALSMKVLKKGDDFVEVGWDGIKGAAGNHRDTTAIIRVERADAGR